MTRTPTTRVLIVVFDALRPEFVTPDQMPNLHAFATDGVWYRNSHAAFFTETRVNQSVVTTGCMPRRHGIVANKFFAPEAMPGQILDTGDDTQLDKAFANLQGRLLDVPTLGEQLKAHGLKFASFSAGTPGGGRLINHSAERDGSFRFAMRRPDAGCPADAHRQLTDRLGPIPQYRLPATTWISWAVDAYLAHIETIVRPDAMLLWLCEPDETFHKLGIGSPEALTTIRHADAEFGRILAHHRDALETGDINIIAMSDHGQISLVGEPIDLIARLNDAGFAADAGPGADIDFVVVPGNAAGIWSTCQDDGKHARLIQWLRCQDWCGPLFTRTGLAGTLTLDHLCLDHARAPDIAMAFRSDDTKNVYGRHGQTRHDAPYPIGGGCHGGLSRYELHNFLSCGGNAFKQRTTLDVPAGNVDITPTVLTLLGLDVPDGLDGRALREAMCDGPHPNDLIWADDIIASSNEAGPTTYLSVTDLGHTRYINRAWIG